MTVLEIAILKPITSTVSRYLPRGLSLQDNLWASRHRAMVVGLWLHVPFLFVFGIVNGHAGFHVALECSLLVLAGLVSSRKASSRNVSMLASTFGLLTASALLVHFSGGVVEMHFHFFVVVAAVTLYQAWLPFLFAIGYVVGQHALIGLLDPTSVYNHPAAQANPFKWALVHGAFILGESVTLLVAWRLSEDARDEAAESYGQRLEEEQARRAAQEDYSRLFENAMEGIYETDLYGNVLTANPALARVLGFKSPDDLIASRVHSYYADPADRDLFIELLLSQGSVTCFEFQARRQDGSFVWLSDNANVVRDESGEVVGIQGLLEDITPRKLAESHRERLEGQLHQAQKMQAVGQLAGGVAHDFNNLLSIIQNYALFSLEGLDEDDQRAKDIQEVVKASQRGATLVKQLMAFSRKDAVTPAVLHPNDTVAESGKMLERTLGENILLTLDLAPSLWQIESDTGHLEQILTNLALNARDAMAEGGELRIKTENVRVREESKDAGLLTPGDYVCLTVRDNGHGMSARVKDRVFEPFFTTKEVGSGTGLGLASVYGIVDHWQGLITVESEEGIGTEFRLFFPRAVHDLAPTSASHEPEFDPEGNEKILVVEDEPNVLDLVQRILRSHGYDVIGATRPSEAVAILDGQGAGIDLLLTDMIMPGMSGKDLADVAGDRFPTMRVMFMSGYTGDALKPHVESEETPLLQKPFSPEQLLAHVRHTLDLVHEAS